MMNIIKLALIVMGVLMVSNVYAVKYKFIAVDNSTETKICVLAGNNERKELVQSIKKFGVDQILLVNKLLCNDMHIANFAQTYNAHRTFKYLKKYTYNRNLNKKTSVHIKDIAYNKQNKNLPEKVILVYVGK